jgi:CHAT domain-containing protein
VESRIVDLSTPRLRALAGEKEGSGAYLHDALSHLREVIAETAPPSGASGASAAADEGSSEALRFLYDLLIAPIDDLLPTAPGAEVVFVPDGSLYNVPFAALQAKDGTCLIDRYTIRLLVSLGDVDAPARSTNHGASSDHALVVANPSPMPDELPPLFGAEREAESVAAVLGTTPLIGNRATLQTVLERLPSVEIAHFATHAVFDEEYGYMSYLVLVPPGPEGIRIVTEDGMLFLSGKEGEAAKGHLAAEAISNLHLRAGVVVLSACNTGRGDITGEGVSGLASAFLSAGAGSVVVALWDVPDQSTELLMTEFYHSLHAGSGTAPALREAMLKTRARTPSPRAWAGFELLGAGS